MPMIDIPAALKPYGVKGLFVGGCVHRGDGSSFRAKAHAHNKAKGEAEYAHWLGLPNRSGWICVRSEKRLWLNGTKEPSRLLWHETAHIWRRSWTEKQCDAWARRQVKRGILSS